MKKELPIIAFILIVSFCLISIGGTPVSVLAQETTPSPSLDESLTPGAEDLVASVSATQSIPSDIRILRDRLASVVAELRKKDEQVVAGEIKTLDPKVIEVDTIAGATEQIQIDETLTKYYRIVGAAKEEIEQKDLKVGQYAIITSLSADGALSANEIYIDEPFDSKAGRITEIDSTNYTFKLETFDKETITVDIVKSVKQEVLNVSTLALEDSSFAKLKEGDTVHIVYPVKSIKQQPTIVTPARLLLIPLAYFNK